MTEAEWLTATDPQPMLEHVRAVRLDPRLRRFSVECCRRVRYLIVEEEFQAAAAAGEAFADDPRNRKDTIRPMASAVSAGWRRIRFGPMPADPRQVRAAHAAVATCSSTDWNAAWNASRAAAQAMNAADPDAYDEAELQHQAGLLRCIFGNPFRPAPEVEPAWLTWFGGIVPRLAQAVSRDGTFDRLAVLADALTEAGCTDAAILGHLRGPGPHCRGCWVVDLLAAKGPGPTAATADRPPPAYSLGQRVRVVLNERNRTPREGTVRRIVWHFKDGRYNYYLEQDDKRVSKRYLREDLEPAGRAADSLERDHDGGGVAGL